MHGESKVQSTLSAKILPTFLRLEMQSIFVLYGLLLATTATPVLPKVKSTPQLIANVTDPMVTRDSCGSVRLQHRELDQLQRERHPGYRV